MKIRSLQGYYDILYLTTDKGGWKGVINLVIKQRRSLSTRPYIDEFGRIRLFVDNELKIRLEAKLLDKILEFHAV